MLSSPFAFSSSPKADSYAISFTDAQQGVIHVEANLSLNDSLLYMSSYGPVPDRWPQYIRNLRAIDRYGNTVLVTPRDSTAWIVEAGSSRKRITVHYDLELTHEERSWPGGIDGVAFQRDWGTMLSGRSLFVMNGQEKENLIVSYTLPAGWQLTTPWTLHATEADMYTVASLEQLQEAFLFAGTHEEIALQRDDFTLLFVLGGDAVTAQKDQYQAYAGSVLDYYIDLLGGVPQPVPGEQLDKTLVLINESTQVDGEVIGSNISMLLNPEAPPQQQLTGWLMFVHEFFHLWNGKTLHFTGNHCDWFKEGITNYYALKALHHIGLADENGIQAILNGLFYQRYVNDPGFGELPPAEAATPERKDQHWGLVYGGGLFAGICLDLQIRHNTQNLHSLDDLMRYFYQTKGGTTQSISNQDILNRANHLGQTDFSNLLEQSVMGATQVPLQQYLALAGVATETTNGKLILQHKPDKTPLQKAIWRGFLGQ